MQASEQVIDEAYWSEAVSSPALSRWDSLADLPVSMFSHEQTLLDIARRSMEGTFGELVNKRGWHSVVPVESGKPLPEVGWGTPRLLRIILDQRHQISQPELADVNPEHFADQMEWFDVAARAIKATQTFVRAPQATLHFAREGVVTKIMRGVYFARTMPSRKRLLALQIGTRESSYDKGWTLAPPHLPRTILPQMNVDVPCRDMTKREPVDYRVVQAQVLEPLNPPGRGESTASLQAALRILFGRHAVVAGGQT